MTKVRRYDIHDAFLGEYANAFIDNWVGLVRVILLFILSIQFSACGGGNIDCYPDVSTPLNLIATASSPSSINLSWEYNGTSDFTQTFNVYRDGTNIFSTRGTTATNSGLLPNTRYCYNVTSKNICGESSASNTSCATTPPDISPPTVPTNLVAILAPEKEASLRWNRSFDNVYVEGYKIYKNGTYMHTVTDETMIDTGLSVDTEYCYSVVAYDYSDNESMPSNTACVDTAWNIQNIEINTEMSEALSLSTDAAGNAHISFYDRLSGYLRYATNKSGLWVLEDIDYIQSFGTQYNSIAIDSNGYVHISYRDNINQVLKYATNQSGSWLITVLDSTASSGNYNSIALDSLNNVHISYYSSGYLSYITNVSGVWVKEILDNSGGHTSSSISVSRNGYVHIIYYSFIDKTIKYITNLSGSWVKSTPTSVFGTFAGSASASIADQNDKLHLCYYSNNSLNYATNLTGNWVSTTNIAVGGQYCSIAVSNTGNIHISHKADYSRLIDSTSYSFQDLLYTTNASSEWKSYTLDSSGAGWYSSISLDGDDKAHIAYMVLYENSLNYATNK